MGGRDTLLQSGVCEEIRTWIAELVECIFLFGDAPGATTGSRALLHLLHDMGRCQ